MSDDQHTIQCVLLKKLTTKAGRAILSLLCQTDISGCDKLTADHVFISTIDPACTSHLNLKPGMRVSVRVGITKNRGRTYVDAYSVKVLNGGKTEMDAFEDKDELFFFPVTGAEMKQYDIILPMTEFYEHDEFEGCTDGFITERPNETTVDEKFEFTRTFGYAFAQWRNTSDPAKDAKFYKVNLRFNLGVLSQAFGVTNEAHWRDDVYANSWLLHADFVILCSLSTNTHAFVRIAEEIPDTMYATGNALLVDLPATVRKIGEKLTLAEVTDMYSAADDNLITEEQEGLCLNVTDNNTHTVEYEKFDYYCVGGKNNTLYDIFALIKC